MWWADLIELRKQVLLKAHVHYVVTEYGRVMLLGRSLAERARSLIAIAAPQFREQLERAAYNLRLFS